MPRPPLVAVTATTMGQQMRNAAAFLPYRRAFSGGGDVDGGAGEAAADCDIGKHGASSLATTLLRDEHEGDDADGGRGGGGGGGRRNDDDDEYPFDEYVIVTGVVSSTIVCREKSNSAEVPRRKEPRSR